jgi:hypothetical protein
MVRLCHKSRSRDRQDGTRIIYLPLPDNAPFPNDIAAWSKTTPFQQTVPHSPILSHKCPPQALSGLSGVGEASGPRRRSSVGTQASISSLRSVTSVTSRKSAQDILEEVRGRCAIDKTQLRARGECRLLSSSRRVLHIKACLARVEICVGRP